ncbi:MAG: hypothetical protein VX574_02070, partial [Myxococcota bacterium]|nr:hypothetical protein [Myxococcota bacterium]
RVVAVRETQLGDRIQHDVADVVGDEDGAPRLESKGLQAVLQGRPGVSEMANRLSSMLKLAI